MKRNLIVTLILCLALAGCARPTPTPEAAPPPTAAAPSVTPSAPAPSPTPTCTATAQPSPTSLPTETPLPTPTAAGVTRGSAWVPPGVDTPIAIITRAWEYTRHGRPAGMDDPSRGCAPFDDSRPVTLLTVTIRVYNRSNETMHDWYAVFSAPDGRRLYACHRDLEQLPALPPGCYVDVTFGAFGEGDVRQVRGYVFDRMLGRSNEVAF